MQQTVTLGEGIQTIRLIPTMPATSGGLLLPVSATYEIFHFGGSEDQAASVATVDSSSATLTAGVGTGEESKRLIEVADTGSFREGSHYALTSVAGAELLVQVRRIVNSTQMLLTANVRGAFPTGSTIQGLEISGAVPADIADNDAHTSHRFLVEWIVTHAYGVETIREMLEVVSAGGDTLALTTDVERLDGTAANLNSRREKVERALEQAHADFWRKAQSRGIIKDGFHPGSNGKAWVTYRAAYLLRVEMGQERDMQMAETHRTEYDAIMQDLTAGSDVSIVTTKDTPKQLTDVDGIYEQWDLC